MGLNEVIREQLLELDQHKARVKELERDVERRKGDMDRIFVASGLIGGRSWREETTDNSEHSAIWSEHGVISQLEGRANIVNELKQQLADSAEAHGEKGKAIKTLTDRVLELEQEVAEWQRSHDEHDCQETLAVEIELTIRERDDAVKGKCKQFDAHLTSLTEANALLREASDILANHPVHLQGNHPIAMNITGWSLRLGDHFNPHSDLGLQGQKYGDDDANSSPEED